MIFVTGEPGIGKTSLVDIFLDQVTARREAWIGRGLCIEQYGTGEAYLPILEALNRLCQQVRGERLVTYLRQYAPTWLVQLPSVLNPVDLQSLLPTIMGATPVRLMRELAEALETFSNEQPVIVSLEDLHWLDASSLEFLTYLARRSGPARLLLLGTYRPADLILQDHPLKTTKQELLMHGQCQELRLECLAEPAVANYLQHRLAAGTKEKKSLHMLAQVVHQRTEGNPLFMVNLVEYFMSHDLIAQKEDEWTVKEDAVRTTIPTGLRQFIDIRVAQLDPEDRHLLAIASIAGMEFNTATIAADLELTMVDIDRHCHDLAREEQFISSSGISEWMDGTISARYKFQHALYQEALYEHVPLMQRTEWHLKIGNRLEQGYAERTRDIAAELALHFERGQDPDRASSYHQQAAEEAAKRSAHHEATLHLTKALRFLKMIRPGPDRDQRELALQGLRGIQTLQTKGFATPEGGEAFSRAHELSQQFPNNTQFIPCLYGLFRFYVTIQDREKAQILGDQLENLAQQTGEPEILLISLICQGGIGMFWGEPQTALSPLQQAITLEEGIDSVSLLMKYGEETRIICRLFLSWVLWALGFPEQSKIHALEALSQAAALKNPFMHVFSLTWNAHTHMMQRDYSQALCFGDEAQVLAQQHGYKQWEVESLLLCGSIHTSQGKTPQSRMDQERGTTLQQTIDNHTLLPSTIAHMIESTLHNGQYQEGLTIAQKSLARMGENGMTQYEAEWIRLKGELILGLSEPDKEQAIKEADACFHEAVMVARKQGAKSLELRAVMSLSRLWHQQGKGKQARPKLKKVYDWFTEGFDTQDLQDAKILLGQLK